MYYERDCLSRPLLGQAMLRENTNMMIRAQRNVDELQLDCAHVLYDDLVDEPINAVRKIYAQFDWKFTKEYEDKLKAFLVADAVKRANVKKSLRIVGASGASIHKHCLEDFGLSLDDINTEAHNDYSKRFALNRLRL